ncbi:hypothetical protein CK203_067557 [Vitis vinifera]|uniref:Uncharacterized protein n=1 Tax=Vitis vinifera TaxID=29760 RepID=A0A438ECH1_VITVI|nr:hypothetical protein CK203_067557 [Vitis vinifera]
MKEEIREIPAVVALNLGRRWVFSQSRQEVEEDNEQEDDDEEEDDNDASGIRELDNHS